jgi:hypothetical protein
VISPLLSSSSSSCLQEHQHALHGVICCLTLCKSFCELYPVVSSGIIPVECPAEKRRRQVQLAVAVMSAGACGAGH